MSTAERLQPGPALRLLRRPRPRWPARDDALLRAHYGHTTTAELAAQLGRTIHGVRWRARLLGLAKEIPVASHQARMQAEIARLRAEIDQLRLAASAGVDATAMPRGLGGAEGANVTAGSNGYATAMPRAAHDESRWLAALMAYRLQVCDAAEVAVVLGVPVTRLPVEVGKAAKLGQEVVRAALEGNP